MAIYHFSGQMISRSKGQSAVASAAYRSGEKLYDERYGQIKFYKRDVTPITFLLKPPHAPEWCLNREKLWNAVESHEKAKNSQLAREFNVALPLELTLEEQVALTKEYCQKSFVDRGMVADVAIHLDDKNNPHFHVMLTTRPFDDGGHWGIKSRKIYLYDDAGKPLYTKAGYRASRKDNTTDWDSKETMQDWRKRWADLTNAYLEKNGFSERITEQSHAALGRMDQPTIHEGVVAREMVKKGKISDRVQINVLIKKENATQEILQDVKQDLRYAEEGEGIQRLLSPNEKKHIATLSNDLKLFINYDNLIEKKRILINWLTNEKTSALFSDGPRKIETILSQDEKVEEAFALVATESNRIMARYYPDLQVAQLSQHAVNRLAEETLVIERPLNREEANRLLTEETRAELSTYLKLIDKRPLETYDEYNHQRDRLQRKIEAFKQTHKIPHLQPESLQALSVEQQHALKYIVKDLERTNLALKVIDGYYTEKIQRIFPTLDVSTLSIHERILYGDAIDYYGDRLTVETVMRIQEQPLFKYDDAAYQLAGRYLNVPHQRDAIQLELAEQYPALLADMQDPRMRTMVFNEVLEKGVSSEAAMMSYLHTRTTQETRTSLQPQKVSLLFRALFRPQNLEQILNALSYEENQQIQENEKQRKKALRKKKKNRMKGLRGNR